MPHPLHTAPRLGLHAWTPCQSPYIAEKAGDFVPCKWCGRTFFPDRLAVHHRVCKARSDQERASTGIRPTMTSSTDLASAPTVGAPISAVRSLKLGESSPAVRQPREHAKQAHGSPRL